MVGSQNPGPTAGLQVTAGMNPDSARQSCLDDHLEALDANPVIYGAEACIAANALIIPPRSWRTSTSTTRRPRDS